MPSACYNATAVSDALSDWNREARRGTESGAGSVLRFPEDLDMRFTAAVSHEQPWYMARCLEVEVTSQEESFDEAFEVSHHG
jgi:hypothetical protein